MEIRENRYFRLLAGFFAVMLALTAISRAADSVTVARVNTEAVRQATLAHRTTAAGKILASDQMYIRGEEGTFIDKVNAAPGQRVEAGDVLFTLDLKSLQDQLLTAETELSELKLGLKRAQVDSGGTAAEREAVETARRDLERARADSELNTELNGGVQLLADKRAVENAEAALRTAEKQLAEAGERNGVDLDLTELKIRQKEREVDDLRRISRSGGQVKAEIAGTVGEVNARAGAAATKETLCTLIPDGAEYIFEAELTDEDAKYMKAGDPVSVLPEGKNVPISGLQIWSIGSSGDKTKVTVRMTADAQVSHGMAASLNHTGISQSYPRTIPLSALRGSERNYYVLTLREANTVLGQELKAEKVEVTLIDKDGKRAAVEEILDGKVISGSSKPVEAGDRVREVQDGDQ